MEESSQGKYQICINCEGRDYLVVVDDLETATQLVNDYDVTLSYIESNPQRCTLPDDLGCEIKDVENSEVTEKVTQEVTNEKEHITEIWTRRKPSERDIEATKVLLTLRQRDFRLFDDKKTSKEKL
ncbi:unnamed protein product [Psylliodes chrysocephalus]|uniref:Uncharacterized protein n=1 Tax=Psylliodes chrysocephalus TaxID=3402493 RepID=A0A9P0GHE7_9CUCU|nr:unnamed protein product [Psylliodes chrysocephala]